MAGDANGQNNLGACYEHGLGCRQSYARAVKWYRLSAAQDCGTATMNLGYCYLRGHGIAADRAEALRLFRLAVTQGEPKAADELERLGESCTEPPARVVDRTPPDREKRISDPGIAPLRALVAKLPDPARTCVLAGDTFQPRGLA
jgi:hypothetical protein